MNKAPHNAGSLFFSAEITMTTVDLNSDLGEGFGTYRCGDDDAMLSIVTSANVACGFHAGDPEIMARTFQLAKERGIAIGAHPSFPDLWGFGRRRMPFTPSEIERIVAYQIGAAQALASYAGHRITYVKPHGALSNVSEVDRHVSDAIARAIRAVDSSLTFLCIARSEQVKAAEACGLAVACEIYADRGYTEEGRLIKRGEPGALIEDSDEAAERALAMVESGAIITTSGRRLKTSIGSICIHGDSPHAVAMAHSLRLRLEAAGVTIAAFAPPPREAQEAYVVPHLTPTTAVI
jgi:5-oxoprolinase (ATP-hydrolysing) subunit A